MDKRVAEKLLKESGRAASDAERQAIVRKVKEWNMLDTSGRAMTEEETERLLKGTFRK